MNMMLHRERGHEMRPSLTLESRQELLQHLDLLDDVDVAFEDFMRANRAYKKAKREFGDDDGRAKEAVGELNRLDHAYRDLRELAVGRAKAFSADLKDVMLVHKGATKKGREKLRALFEYAAPENVEAPVVEAEPSAPEAEVRQEDAEAPQVLEDVLQESFGLHEARPVPTEAQPRLEVPASPEVVAIDAILSGEAPSPASPTHESRSFFARFRESRFARVLGLGAILGVGAEIGQSIKEYRERVEHSYEAMQELRVDVMTPLTAHLGNDAEELLNQSLPNPQETIRIMGYAVERGKVKDSIDSWYTNLLTEAHVPIQNLYEDCSVELSGGGHVLDAVKCDLLYGNQIPLNEQAEATLASMEDLSVNEYRLLGEVIRDSVYTQPTGMVMGVSGVLGMIPYNAESLTTVFRADRDKLYDAYFRQAKDIAHVVFDAVPVDTLDSDAKHQLKEDLAHALRQEVELGNQLTVIASLLETVHYSSANEVSLKKGVKDVFTGVQHEPVMERTLRFLNKADAYWGLLEQHFPSEDVAVFTAGLHDARQNRLHQVLERGRVIDYRDSDFYDSLADRIDSGL